MRRRRQRRRRRRRRKRRKRLKKKKGKGGRHVGARRAWLGRWRNFRCVCVDGYTGIYCEQAPQLGNCASHPCHDGQSCTEIRGGNGYACTYQPHGTHTSKQIRNRDTSASEDSKPKPNMAVFYSPCKAVR